MASDMASMAALSKCDITQATGNNYRNTKKNIPVKYRNNL